jgi:hypothetical protein
MSYIRNRTGEVILKICYGEPTTTYCGWCKSGVFQDNSRNIKSDFSGSDLGYLKIFRCLIIPTLLEISGMMPREPNETISQQIEFEKFGSMARNPKRASLEK